MNRFKQPHLNSYRHTPNDCRQTHEIEKASSGAYNSQVLCDHKPLDRFLGTRMSFHNHITKILPLIGQNTDRVELIKRRNDVFRLSSGTDRFFLKTYTKNRYGLEEN